MAIYGLRTRPLGQTSYYSITENCQKGDFALLESEHGPALGKIVSGPHEIFPGASETELPGIIRMANAEDRDIHAKNSILGEEAAAFCKKCIKMRRLDMKLVDVEVFFDRSKFIFYFTAPNRIDFRELVKDLVREYRARIELRQIGVRHETQMVGAIGNCGMVCCCRGHLRKFAPVTIKMAKEQNLFLNPSKISGICGRLLCCLSYEQENYENFNRACPRQGKKYHTDKGPLKVIQTNLFKNSVTVVDDNNEEREIAIDEWRDLHPEKADSRSETSDENESAMMESEDNCSIYDDLDDTAE